MEKICRNETFFDLNKFLNQSNPEFSDCFQEIVLKLFPCLYLWIFALPNYFHKRNSPYANIHSSCLFNCRIVLTVILKLFSLVNVCYSTYEYFSGLQIPLTHIFSPALTGTSMVIVLAFLKYELNKGIKSSGYLPLFWFLCVVFWAFIAKSKIETLTSGQVLSQGETIRTVLFFGSYFCIIIKFILSFFVDGIHSNIKKDPHLKPEETNDYALLYNNTKPQISPEGDSSFWSWITYHWFNGMIWKGYKNPLKDEDLYALDDENKAARNARKFLKFWNKEKQLCKCNSQNLESDEDVTGSQEVLILPNSTTKMKKPSLLKVLIKTFGPGFIKTVFLKLLNDIMEFINPQLLSAVIGFNESTSPLWQGYCLAVFMFLTACFQSILLNLYFYACLKSGLAVRSAIISTVYRKSLTLSSSARKESTAGEVVNLMSVDTQHLQDILNFINIIWSGPFQIIVAMVFLYLQLGNSVFAGVGLMVFLIPVNGFLAQKAFRLENQQMKLKDERIKIMSEVLNGIKLLKMYSWEMSFMEKIMKVRKDETDKLKTSSYLMSFASVTWALAPFLVSLVTFAVYVLSDPNNVLDAQTAFVSLSLFQILRFPVIVIPLLISSMIEANVSLKRLEKFLCNDELDPENVQRLPDDQSKDQNVISVEDGSFSWSKADDPILSDINLDVKKGSLVAIVGQVGCGKSSLLSALLGGMEKLNGDVLIKGSTAYVPQQAWIQNLTAKNNILFGSELNEKRYQKTIKACQLMDDFLMLPAGDKTEIGERGINLSGGQKQRLSVARAVYQDLDIYLLDDPLSAVDAHVGKAIFEEVIGPNGILQNKTRLLVTHGMSYLKEVDEIIVITNGRISEVGSYDSLVANNGSFAEFLRNFAANNDSSGDEEDDDVTVRKRSRSNRISESAKLESSKVENDEDKLIVEERSESGNIKFKDVKLYIKSLRLPVVLFLLLTITLQNASDVFSGLWLSEWSNDPIDPVTGQQNSTIFRLAIYGCLGASEAIFLFFGNILLTYGSIAAAVAIHTRMLKRVICAPMSFFDTTPHGRIINRFSKDINLIDEVIPHDIHDFLWTFFSVLAIIATICYSFPLFLIAIIPIFIIYYIVQRVYVKTSRQLKRLESIRRSPIYSFFGESLSGASTIRAYCLEDEYIKQNEINVDFNQSAFYPNIISNRWLALRITVIGSSIVLFAALFAVIERGKINSGLVGLSISYAIQATETMNWLVRQASKLETDIVAVERVEEYCNIEQEASLTGGGLNDDWPHGGAIKYENYSTRYREGLDLVVKDINLDIKSGEKIGVVGRTGAGKSSLTLALFRIIESASGRIVIDDEDVSKIGLHDLRSKLAIIPQDPILFSGTLRFNLDPFERYSDEELWRSLELSHLKTFISSTDKKLEHEISEGGDNLSVGQRQLVCLARALLKNSKILVLDEATAAVDLETDALIQVTIREQFKDCTIFTIAHRLNTIRDSDKIVVLDKGIVDQFDSPENLLKDENGIFYQMCKDAKLV